MKAYVAGPFFNDAQCAHYDAVVEVVERRAPAFSVPRDGIIAPPNADHETQENAFNLNVKMIEECSFMVCILDYLGVHLRALPLMNADMSEINHKGRTIRGSLLRDLGAINFLNEYTSVISLPDSGVVFEMGGAHVMNKAVFGIILNKANLNLMLARGCNAIANNLEELDGILEVFVPTLDQGPSEQAEALLRLRNKMWTGVIE